MARISSEGRRTMADDSVETVGCLFRQLGCLAVMVVLGLLGSVVLVGLGIKFDSWIGRIATAAVGLLIVLTIAKIFGDKK
jgi:hypothetical protein